MVKKYRKKKGLKQIRQFFNPTNLEVNDWIIKCKIDVIDIKFISYIHEGKAYTYCIVIYEI